jgi:hypothetical protein
MPWEVKKNGDQYCVYKKGASSPIKGGCHDTKSDATAHMRALYSNVTDASADYEISSLTVMRGIEMLKTGVDYPLASGTMSFTIEDLAAIKASQEDPAIQSPRLKIGHIDPRFDGEPALGKWTNLSIQDEGNTLVGDIVGVPKWLAGIMGSAYPARSIEGNRDVETVTGSKWRVVVESVALLGIQWPGVTTLKDLPILFSEEGPDGVEVVQTIAAARQRMTAANVDDVRRQYYDQLDTGLWWWIREIYVSPNELIVDDDEGGLYRVPYTIEADDSITYGDPTPVKIVYQDVPAEVAASLYAQGLHDANKERVVASYPDRESARPDPAEKGAGMDPEVLQALGLPEDATTAQVVAAIEAQKAETPPKTDPETEPEEEPEEEPDEEDPEANPEEETTDNLVKMAAKRGQVLVDSATMEEIKAGAAAGRELHRKAQQDQKQRVLTDAVQAGKFPPSRLDHYGKLYDADPEGTVKMIAGLEAGLIPTEQRGVAGDGEGMADEAYPDSWFPELAAAKAGRKGVPGQGTVINERKVVNN